MIKRITFIYSMPETIMISNSNKENEQVNTI